MYTAVVLSETDRNNLVAHLNSLNQWNNHNYMFRTSNGDVLPHHVTLNMGSVENGPNHRSIIGSLVYVTIDAFCWDDRVCAARVVEMKTESLIIKTVNKQAHITMCLKQNQKPFMSNGLEWEKSIPLQSPMVITGIVEECT